MSSIKLALAFAATLTIFGCVETSIQPMSQNTFKVATVAAPACGAAGARKAAFQTVAIEVIRRGGDRFIVLGDQSGSQFSGLGYTAYGGFTAYSSNLQDMVIRVLSPNDPEYSNGLSARETLGPDWQEVYASGAPDTCG